MRQVFQDLKTGETRLAEVPRPGAGPISVARSLIAARTGLLPGLQPGLLPGLQPTVR